MYITKYNTLLKIIYYYALVNVGYAHTIKAECALAVSDYVCIMD